MKRKKSMKSLVCGLAVALLALTSLSTAALAYWEPAQFSDWLLSAAGDPQAVEETLAAMGTVLGQSQTVDGVTLTLEGAVWNGGLLQLSFAIQGANIPKDIPSGTSLNRHSSQITLAERQREAYLSKGLEDIEKTLAEAGMLAKPSAQAERDAEVQSMLSRGEPRFVHRFQLIRSGGKDILIMTVPAAADVE